MEIPESQKSLRPKNTLPFKLDAKKYGLSGDVIGLSLIQIDAILELQLHRLTRLSIDDILKELADIRAKIAELKEQAQTASLTPGSGKPSARQTDQATQLGLTVRALDPSEKEQVQTTGTLVVEDATGPAAAAGVQPGDIILGINGKRVKTAKELQDSAKSSGKNVALLIQRDDAQIFVPLRLQ